jgi:hypothetical protein
VNRRTAAARVCETTHENPTNASARSRDFNNASSANNRRVERVVEKPPADVEEPGRERREKSVEPGEQEVLGAVALPLDNDLDTCDRQSGRHRHQDRHETGTRPGGLGRDEHSARRHGLPTVTGVAMGTLRV